MSQVKIIPLGGVREHGKNLFIVEVNESIFILDCGLVYPEDELLGIDAVIPDYTYLEENADRIVGIFLTHGHADAVGGLPYLLDVIHAPVFGTELTIELASITAKSQGLADRLENFYVIDEDTEIEFKDAVVSFFRTTHSIPDSVGIVIQTDDGSVVYTGDFRFDPGVSANYATNFGRLTDIGKAGVLALLSDSASAESPVENSSDSDVQSYVTEVFRNAKGRVIVACVGSNIARIQQIINAAHQAGRRIVYANDDVFEIIDVALKLDKLEIPSKSVLANLSDLPRLSNDEVVVIETGNSGDPLTSLQEMASHQHKKIEMKEGDLVFIASTPSTAMETMVAKTKDAVYRAGGTVMELTDGIQTSGHATPHDLKLMLSFMDPKFFIPVNGEYRMLDAHAQLAKELGMADWQILFPQIGDVISIAQNKARISSEVEAGDVLVDGSGVGDIGSVVLRDRRILSEEGIFVVVATISRRLKRVLVGPQITSRGFVFMKASGDLIATCSDMTLDVLEEHLQSNDFEWAALKNDLRERIGKYLFKETKRRPVIMPIIMEASGYQLPEERKK